MRQSAEAKLHELRDKTNQELVSLIGNKLDRGLAFARMMEGEDHSNWASRELFAVSAEKACADASAWMALLTEATPLERRRLEFKLAQLRKALDRTPAPEVRVQAAC